MITFKLNDGDIFEASGNTGHTYMYIEGKITEITMQEYNLITSVYKEERAKVLKEFRFKNGIFNW